MKIASLTQTYGNRILEMETGFQNTPRVRIFNELDAVYLSFHNVPEDIQRKHEDTARVVHPKLVCRQYRNLPYGYTIHHRLHELKSNGFTDILFCQDDHYFIEHTASDRILKSILDFYRTRTDIAILHFSGASYAPDGLLFSKCLEEQVILGQIKARKFNSTSYGDACPYDDSPYLAKIDFLLQNVFTKEKVHMDVWNLEYSTMMHWRNFPVEKWECNSNLPCLPNFSGRNVNTRWTTEQKLQQLKGMMPTEQSMEIDRMSLSFPTL